MRRSTSWLVAAGWFAAAFAVQAAARTERRPVPAIGRGLTLLEDQGQRAAAPFKVEWRRWWDILVRTYYGVDEDRLLAVSGGVVFFVLLAIFPSITAFVSLYGLFSSPIHVAADLQPIMVAIPADGASFLVGEVQRIAAKSTQTLSLATGVSLALALWSANAGTKSLFDALNVAYGEREKRGFIRLNIVSFAFTIGMILFLMLAAGAVIVVPLLVSYLGLGGLSASLWPALRWPLLFLVTMGGLSVLYRFGPSRSNAKWRWLSIGGFIATVLWLIASLLFAWYLANFADYNGTYGSLGAVIGLLTWLWLSVIAVLLGAELDAEIGRDRASSRPAGRPEALAIRRGRAVG